MEWPKITIVTPTLNRAEFLEEAIRSVLDQDYPNLEYIVVDGGSTNPAIFEIIRKYEKQLAWWISEPDKGHAEAIGKGFDRSSGEIMNWLCSDDTYTPGALRAVADVFQQRPDIDVVYGHHETTDENSRVVRNGRVVRYHPLTTLAYSNIHQASVFWRRRLYERVGGRVGGKNLEYNVYSPDSDLFMRFARASERWYFLPRTLSTFRRHLEQTTTRETDLVWQHYWRAARENFPFWTRPGIYQAVALAMRVRRYARLILQGDGKYLYSKLRGRVIPQRY